ncbi:MAG: hypothetical protein WDW38_010484 [Sanguina aurantia]
MSNPTICTWSGPRSCSTSLLYAFSQRTDTLVLDEPLYASFLTQTGLSRPYRDQVLKEQDSNGNEVMRRIRDTEGRPVGRPLLYAKHMSKQRLGLDAAAMENAQHVLLVREPYGVVQSFSKTLTPTHQELGYTALLEIQSELRAAGRPPIVLLSDDLIKDPEGMLRALCQALSIPFQSAMLRWPAGPKPFDGVWAPWWYSNTHKSTGFGSGVRDPRLPLAHELKQLYGECCALFQLLRRDALSPLSPPTPGLPRTISMPSGALISTHSRANGGGTAAAAAAAAAAATQQQGAGRGHAAAETGTHVYSSDARNADVLVGIRDGVLDALELVWRPLAKVSVLDSGFMLGDGVWEGVRLHAGCLMFVEEHMDRLYEGAKALDMDLCLSPQQLVSMVYEVIDANGMAAASGVHIRLMVTRGLKPTPYQNPNTTIGKPTIVILPEYKEASRIPKEQGIRLFTCHVRRGAPDVQDPMLNSHSKLNCIAACIQANKAGVDEALMLDPHGFVATCNSTNFLMVKKGALWAPTTKYQLHGITRSNILDLAAEAGIPTQERDIPLTQAYSADEAFVTGTFAGLIPVVEIDGRMIGKGTRGPVTQRLQQLYVQRMEEYASTGRRSVA